MELPKNITQIGESDKNCKIYVEDYVVSYMKQMNRLAKDKEIAIAIYGNRTTEQSISYLFAYGACKLRFLSKQVRHLSQAQYQEIEKLRKQYFGELEFIGYCILIGEMVEGFYIHEQDTCRYVGGYACFYEKNDNMLAYMLDTKKGDHQPEEIDQEKYDKVKQRQEERKNQGKHEEKPDHIFSNEGVTRFENRELKIANREKRNFNSKGSIKWMRIASLALFFVLCGFGIYSTLNQGKEGNLGDSIHLFLADITEQKIPDAEEVTSTLSEANSETIIADDNLTEAIQEENIKSSDLLNNAITEEQEITQIENSVADDSEAQTDILSEASVVDQTAEENTDVPAVDSSQNTSIDLEESEESIVTNSENVSQSSNNTGTSYTIEEGDTLIGISVRYYGDESKVDAICTYNQIANADDIKIGQNILLP